MLTKDKITEIYCIADDFCKESAQEIKKLKLTVAAERQKAPQADKSAVEFTIRCILTRLGLSNFS